MILVQIGLSSRTYLISHIETGLDAEQNLTKSKWK